MHGNVMFKTLRVLKRFQNNGSVCLLISLLDTQVLPNVFTIECRAITSISRGSRVSFKHVSL